MDNELLIINMDDDIELKANKYCVKCNVISIITILIMLLFNELRVFIVDKDLFRKTYILANICYLIPIITARLKGINNKYYKYLALFCYVTSVMILNTFLTYHSIILLGMPFLMAAHYKERKLSLYVYFLTMISITVSVICGYRFGLTDLNYIYETTGVTTQWNEVLNINVMSLNIDKLIKLILFFAIPRVAAVTIYANMAYSVAESVSRVEERKNRLHYESIHDQMTGLYNKKYYEALKENVYKQMDKVGIMFLDINNLKYVNDNLGHDKGDELIIMASNSISNIVSNEIKGFRIGGDEFLVIVKEPQEGEMQNIKTRWQRNLDEINKASDSLQCEIAIGVAEGDGNNFDEVYTMADKQMYEDKSEKKKIKLNK